MIVFIDTSSLLKRYVWENGSEKLSQILQQVTTVIISPTTIVEMYSALTRRLHDKSLSASDYKAIEKELLLNAQDIAVVRWSEELASDAVHFVKKYRLRTMDAIQLASANQAKVAQFITSDKQLSLSAKKEFKNVQLI